MRSLPTQDQIDCLIADGIDAKRLPAAGSSPAGETAVPPPTVPPQNATPALADPKPDPIPGTPPMYYTPHSSTGSRPGFPVALVVLVVVLIILIATMHK